MSQFSIKATKKNEPDEKIRELPPYHVFKRLGSYFVFDTSACRFYKIDEPTYEFLKLCLDFSIEEVKKKLIEEGEFSAELIEGVTQEITFLSKNGLFDVTNYSFNEERLKKDLDRTYSKPVHSIELALAETCNLACKYCYCETTRNVPNNGLMTEKVAHQAIMWLFEASKDIKKLGLTFFGGEPLLNKSVIRSIVEYSQCLAKLHGKTVTYSMTTNATLIDDEFATYIRKHKINVMVSLDGPCKIHDAQCPTKSGKSSYDLAAAGAKRMLNIRPTNVRCTMIHPMPNLRELIDFFDDFGFKRSIIGPTTNPVNNPSPVDFTEKDFAELSRQEEALIPWLLEKLAVGEKPKYTPFDKFIARMKNCTFKTGTTKCGACHNCLYVAADGTLYPCHRFGGMEGWQLGHISSGPDYERYKKFWSDYRKSLAPSCETCWAWPVCKGPCPWEISRPDGTFETSIRFCEFRKARVEYSAYVYAWKQEHNIPNESNNPVKKTAANINKIKPNTSEEAEKISIIKNTEPKKEFAYE